MKRGFSIAMAVLAAMACTPEMEVSGEWGLCLDPAGVVTADSLLGERADSLFADAIVLPGTTDLAGKALLPWNRRPSAFQQDGRYAQSRN